MKRHREVGISDRVTTRFYDNPPNARKEQIDCHKRACREGTQRAIVVIRGLSPSPNIGRPEVMRIVGRESIGMKPVNLIAKSYRDAFAVSVVSLGGVYDGFSLSRSAIDAATASISARTRRPVSSLAAQRRGV